MFPVKSVIPPKPDIEKSIIKPLEEKIGEISDIKRTDSYAMDSIGVIKECNITMSVNSSQLLLDKNDIDKYGKEHMYLVAENCLNKVYNILEKDKLIK